MNTKTVILYSENGDINECAKTDCMKNNRLLCTIRIDMLHIIKGAWQYMQIIPMQLTNQNKIIDNYRHETGNIMQYFDYGVSAKDLKERLDDLNDYSFKRKELTKVLMQLNAQWGAPQATLDNIKKLDDEQSVVVIGGQQAGLLTGPMYTINKIISIIKYAKQQEAALKVPVIPVFWIAGEDHDFDEVNHIYLPTKGEMKKNTSPQYTVDKKPVSEIALQKSNLTTWLENIFEHLQETEYTKNLYKVINGCIEQSQSYVDFFAQLIFKLFQKEGIVLIDSGNTLVRQLERDYFISLIDQQDKISTGVYGTWQDLKRCDYQVDIDLDLQNGHLYFHMNNERILLNRTRSGRWIGKNNEVEMTTEELIEVARKSPEKLSNNVVSRPLMQELLFPTLAFIGGPGEISYWSTLKPAFNALDMKMPPVIPRLSMTYISAPIAKLIKKYDLNLTEIIHTGLEKQKKSWLNEKIEPQVEEVALEVKENIELAHKPLRDIAHQLRDDLGAMAEKNLFYLNSNIDFLEKRISDSIKEQYHHELTEFNNIELALYPMNGLQERVWNPLLIFNEYGTNFIYDLLEKPLSFDKDHYLIYI